MRVKTVLNTTLKDLRKRLASEDGFTVMIALGVLVITSLIAAGAFAAVQADTPLAQRDLDGKRAYYAARSGVNQFLYELNQNPSLWQTCPTKGIPTPVAIAPGSTEKYSYKPVPANGSAACSPSPPTTGDPITTFIDTTTGTFQMQFTGYAGGSAANPNGEVKRGLIATFRKDTPLDYLWFTIYETLDPNTYPVPANYADCNKWERPGAGGGRDDKCRDISFITNDHMNGPTYTQDQYLIAGSPTFGRSGTNDKTESSVPETAPESVCSHYPTAGACGGATFFGTRAPSAPIISLPPSSDSLLADATKFGGGNGGPPGVQTGVTKIVLKDDKMDITNCQVTCSATPQVVNIGKFPGKTPIVYVKSAASPACDPTYSPYNPTYPASGSCGTVYVHGSYTRSLTIAADADIIIDGPISKGTAAPAPVLGLTAKNFVRVMHGIGGRPANADSGDCGSNTILDGNPVGEPNQTFQNIEIDAAVLALKHSFIVDNYDCGTAASTGILNLTGAIAQTFRGTVGTHSGGNVATGYTKSYNYDDRFAVAQPPYLFDIASSSWHIARETLCVPGGAAASTTCEPAS